MMKSLLCTLLCLGMTLATPTGAPTTACESMTPVHAGNIPQNSTAPYSVSVGPIRVLPRATALVTITGHGNNTFRGFFVQARDADNVPVGTFEVDTEVKTIDCDPGTQNAATHVNRTDKARVEISWIAPSTPTDVTFSISIVQIYEYYWTGIQVPLTVTFDP